MLRLRPSAVSALLLAALLASISSCGGGSDSTEATKAAPTPRVSLSAPGHSPQVGAPWPIMIRAVDPSGRPLRAEVRYQYLFAGAVVARRSHYRFKGTFHDTLRWPARSEGVPLTFRAVVTTPLGTRRLDYDVRVRRGSR